jgi:hypothetical protein
MLNEYEIQDRHLTYSRRQGKRSEIFPWEFIFNRQQIRRRGIA